MLTFHGLMSGQKQRSGFCSGADHPGLSRRDFLQIGGLTLGGLSLSLPGLLQAEELAGVKASGKSLINIYLGGGPTHMDTFDMKPKAPKEYRGELNPIATNVAGVEICELMPELAQVADKYSIIRSVDGMNNEHNAKQSESGWSTRSLDSIGGRPGVASVMSKMFGPAQDTPQGTAPTAVDLTGWTKPGFLGQTHSSYRPDGTGRANLTLNRSVSVDRLGNRRQLLAGLDRMRSDSDRSGMMNAMDSFNDRAVGIISSGHLASALDARNESDDVKRHYGIDSSREGRNNDRFLLSRKLIEAGVRCVSFAWGGWDTHGNNFGKMREQLPALSRGLTGLITDLDRLGRLDDTIIMMSGEFGRTPRINGNAGRDHWSRSAFFFLAGGGMTHGQTIGATNAKGEQPQDRPVRLQHIFHTLYHQLGIDADTMTLIDPNGRPQYLVEERELIRELV